MPDRVISDSSVIVAALRQQEEHHQASRAILDKVGKGDLVAVQPYTVLIEVGAAIKRRTGSQSLSERITRDMQAMNTFFFLDLDSVRAQRALEIAQELGLRGMDAVVVQAAEELDATLVSLDAEMTSKVTDLVNAKTTASV